ncbi:MAG: hypothetical protein AABZ39_03045 [Spirochaetota bacterium]
MKYFLAAALAALTFISCSLSDEAFVANELAEDFASQENGTATEVNDTMNLFIGGDSGTSTTTVSATVQITASNGTLTGFSWDATTNGYKRTVSNLGVSIPGRYSGTIQSATIYVWFFTTLDASGVPVPLPNVAKSLGDAANASIRSLKYSRASAVSLNNIRRAIERTMSTATVFTATGINDGSQGVTLSGSRTASNHATGSSLYTGDWTTTQTFSALDVKRSVSADGVVYAAFTGTIAMTLLGTYTGPRGTRTIDRSAALSMSGTRTVTVTADGISITVDVATGDTSE